MKKNQAMNEQYTKSKTAFSEYSTYFLKQVNLLYGSSWRFTQYNSCSCFHSPLKSQQVIDVQIFNLQLNSKSLLTELLVQLGGVWHSHKIISYVTSFLSTFRVVYWLKRLSWDIYIIVFYVCIFLLFCVIIDFIYVAYSYKNRKFPFVWPIQLLRYACKLLATILFIPLMELFFSFSLCGLSSKNNTIVHVVYQDVQCFQGIHILHVSLSYLIILIYLAMTVIIIKCYYESRAGRDPMAKLHSESDILMMIQKMLYVMAYTFFGYDSHYYWFLAAILFVGSAVVFVSYAIQRPYYDTRTQKGVNVLNALLFWTNIILLLSCLIFSVQFSGSLSILLLGVPFIIMITINLKDDRKEQLMKGIPRLQKGEEVQKYITFYLMLIDMKEENRDAALTLKGFVNHHSEFCLIEDCPLKNYKVQQKKQQKQQYGQFGQQQTLYNNIQNKNQVTSLESHALLISQAKNFFLTGIKKFPKDNGLKIGFAVFLMQKMHNKKDALKELINAERQNPSFEEQFMIFRYRQIIEDELHEGSEVSGSGAGGGLDYVAAVNFENHFNQFKTMIEKSAYLHYEFWNHLMDDQPDLARLSEQGTKINQSISNVEDQWKKLTQQSTQTPKALRLYASFLIEILNDKELGNEQLMKAKEAALARVNFDFNNINEDTTDMSSFAADGSPCIYISGEQEADKLGIITQCNLSACRIFGYNRKEELLNQNVEILMPKIYAKQHRKFLEQAIQKPPDLLNQKERQVFGKHCSGFIFPIWFQVKNLPSFLSGRQFVATFKQEKSGINKSVAHLILDKNKEVIDISSSCLTMLDIDLSRFQKEKVKFDISLLLPSLFGANYYQFINKTGSQIEYQFPQIVKIDKENNKKEDNEDEDDIDQNIDGEDDEDEKSYQISNEDEQELTGSREPKRHGTSMMFNSQFMLDDNALNPGGEDGEPLDREGTDQSGMPMGGRKIIVKDQIDEVDGEDEESLNEYDNHRGRGTDKFDYKIVANSTKTASFQCNMIEIHFETQNLDNPNPGYYIRLETLHDKQTHVAKIQKTLKQGAFQFSYDSLKKNFHRELRDKDNKEILLDKLYLQLKKMKEQFILQQKNGLQQTVPSKVLQMTYMSYLSRHQKWIERGGQGNVLDDILSEDGSSHDSSDVDDEDKPHKKGMASTNSTSKEGNDTTNSTQQAAPFGIENENLLMDLKKFIPGEGSGKEFLKSEIERMINVLRKKQESGLGVHCFRRIEPNPKNVHALASQLNQYNRFEETQFSLAGLFSGRSADKVVDLDDDSDGKDEESERDKSKNDSMRNTIKSRKAFSMAINDKSVPAPIKRLSRVANIILLCLIAIAVADYSIVFTQLKSTITNYQVIENSYKRIAEIQKVCYNVRSLIMINNKILNSTTQGFTTQSLHIQAIKNDIQKSLEQLYDIQNQVNLAQLDVSEQHKLILDEKTVNLFFKQDMSSMKAIQFSLTEAILQIQSSIFTLSNQPLPDFIESNEDVFFLMYNSFNELHQMMLRSSNLYVNELKDRSAQRNEISLILFILSIVFLTIIIIVLVPVVRSVNRQKDKVLSLFCDIDDSTIRLLIVKCEKFINKIQTEDQNNDEMESNDEIELQKTQDDDLEYSSYSGGQSKKTKRSKNNTKTNKMFYVKFIGAILLVELYYAYNYGMQREFMEQTQVEVHELNLTSSIEPYYQFTLNVQREFINNMSKPILNRNSFGLALQLLDGMYLYSKGLESIYQRDFEYLPEKYMELYHYVLTGDLCMDPAQTYFIRKEDCANFVSGIAKQGLGTVMVNQARTYRLQLAQSQLRASISTNQTIAQANVIGLVNAQSMYELYVMQHEFNQKFTRLLVRDLTKMIIEGLDTRLQNRLFGLILFLILFLLAFVSIWIPLVNQLNTQIYKTKLMLMIIPLEILMRLKNIGKVLQSQNFIQDKGRSISGRSSSKSDSRN